MNDTKQAYDFVIWIYTHCGHFDTVIFAFPVILFTTLIYWVTRRILHKRKFGSKFKEVRKAVRHNELIRLLTVCWLTALFCLTLTPTEFWKDLWLHIIAGENPIGVLFPQLIGLPARHSGSIVLTPIVLNYAIKGYLDWFLLSGWLTIPQLLLNVVLFVPLGLAAPFISKKSSFLKVAVTGLSLSFFIEFIQIFIGRECEMDDLICNTLGTIIGYLMYLLIKRLFPKFVEKGKKTTKEIWEAAIEAENQAEKKPIKTYPLQGVQFWSGFVDSGQCKVISVLTRKCFAEGTFRRILTMKNFKKIVACGLASVLMCTSFATSASAASVSAVENADLGLDRIDAILASHYFLASSQNDMNFWSADVSNVDVVPLYDTKGEISSYYVELSDGCGYAVINNNAENPTAIEFGRGCNPQIREILDNIDEPHIIYNNPISLYDAGEIMTFSDDVNEADIYDNYPDLLEPNPELANEISQQRALLENTPMLYGDGDYGFIDWGGMSSGSYNSNYLSGYDKVDWVSTGETSKYANNHCGSVAVANLALYFAYKGKTNLKVGDRILTFRTVHRYVGDGPKMTIADDAVKYFKFRGYILNYSTDRSTLMSDRISAENEAIDNGRPCGLLLEDALLSWHWILAVGYRNYTNGDKYFQIVDGWNNNADRFYKPGTGSNWVSMTEYWVK